MSTLMYACDFVVPPGLHNRASQQVTSSKCMGHAAYQKKRMPETGKTPINELGNENVEIVSKEADRPVFHALLLSTTSGDFPILSNEQNCEF